MTTSGQEKSVVREYVEAILIAVILAVFIRTFVIQAFKIPSGSMLPTLLIGDHLLVSKFSYGVRLPFAGVRLIPGKDPVRGDIVVFRFPEDRAVDYIKRVMALPGETIKIVDKKVYINDAPIEDPHARFSSSSLMSAAAGPRDNFGPVTVPPGKIFVMGDNRDNSYDSRFWGFVDEKDILGRALLIYWSWDLDKSLFSLDRITSIRWDRLGDFVH